MGRTPIVALLFLPPLFFTLSAFAQDPALPADRPTPPMDLESATPDQNGFWVSPNWAWQSSHANLPDPKPLCGNFAVQNSDDPLHPPMSLGQPPCTSQHTDIDYPYGFHDLICVNFGGDQGSLHGHVNWRPAVYSGDLLYEELTPIFQLGDGDFNFSLIPENSAGLTRYNGAVYESHRLALGIEFDSSEMKPRWHSHWWQLFLSADDAERRRMVGGTPARGSHAIVWGLLGLDSEHFAHSELHPVYAMAIEDPTSTTDDDIWRFFVRNWGNEGFCSQFQHNLAGNQSMVLFIPRPGARSADLGGATVVASSPAGLRWSFAPVADGVVLTFQLGGAQAKALFDGELHIKWIPAAPGTDLVLSRRGSKSPAHAMALATPQNVASSAEERVKSFWSRLSPANQREVASELSEAPEASASGPALKVDSDLPRSPFLGYLFLAPPVATQIATVTTVIDESKIKRDLLRSQALCRLQSREGVAQLIPKAQCERVLNIH